MYPPIIFHIFPFLLVSPTQTVLPAHPHQPGFVGSTSVQVQRRSSNGNPDYSIRQGNVNFYHKNPYALQFSITYPVTSLSPAKTVREGDKCFTNDGRFGVCRQKFQCNFYTHYTSIYAERITSCGQRGQSVLICCPEGQGQNLQNLNTKPSIPTPTGKKPESTSKTEQTSPFTLSNEPTDKGNESGGNKFMTNVPPSSGPSPAAAPPTVTMVPVDRNNSNGSPMIVHGFDFSSNEAQKVCGVYDSKSKLQQENSWPWIVSIGRKYSNNTIEWFCLGSLITTEYILTTAHCLQGSPTVAALGQLYIGSMATTTRNVILSPIAEYFQFGKFAHPAMYKNVGLVRLLTKTEVSAGILPVCFPFLAGVLDILDFSGATLQTMGFRTPVRNDEGMISQFEIAEYRAFNNTVCSRVVNSSPSVTLKKKLPRGVKSDIMCAISKTKPPLCSIAGAPLVIFDAASDSYVVVGLSLGDPTCSEFETKIALFNRINSFSTWVREQVDELPTPPPCYV